MSDLDYSLDGLVRKHTSARSFADLCGEPDPAKSSYRPSLRVNDATGARRVELAFIADKYDAAMEKAGSPKRAYRGATPVAQDEAVDEEQLVELTPKGLAATVEA